MKTNTILIGDARAILKNLPADSIDCVITSPPYWGLRDYNNASQLGLEKTPEDYVANMVKVFAEVRRVLKPAGTCWINLGDSYISSPIGHKDAASVARSSTIGVKIDDQVVQGAKFDKTKIPGYKTKDLVGIPWRIALALQSDGWYLRQDIIWSKPNPMPESVTDRCTKSHEYIFLLTKSPRYYFDQDAIKEKAVYGGSEERLSRAEVGQKSNPTNKQNGIRPRSTKHNFRRDASKRPTVPGQKMGTHRHDRKDNDYNIETRNKRSVWSVATKPFKGAHFATFPEDLIVPAVLAGCPEDGIVLDPFFGSGTTGAVAKRANRRYIGIELNPEYVELAEKRLAQEKLL